MRPRQPRSGERHNHAAAIMACAGASALMLIGACAPAGEGPQEQSSPSTSGYVVALRMSNNPGVGGQSSFEVPRGYLVLAEEDGTTGYVKTGIMEGSGLQWTDEGLFFSDKTNEYLVDDESLHAFPREWETVYEVGRFETEDRGGSISFYSAGGTQRAVATYPSGITDYADNVGAYMVNGHCADRALSVTSSLLAPAIAPAAAAAQQPQSGAPPEDDDHANSAPLDALVQVYPHEGDTPPVLGAAPQNRAVSTIQRDFICFNDNVYIPTFNSDNPGASKSNGQNYLEGTLALDEWNLATGARFLVTVTDEQGAPIDITNRDVAGATGVLSGAHYVFVTNKGDVYRINLTTGVADRRFTIPLSVDNNDQQYFVTPRAVYVVEGPADRSEELVLKQYALDTSQERTIMTIKGAAQLRGGSLLTGRVYLQSVALRPDYAARLEP